MEITKKEKKTRSLFIVKNKQIKPFLYRNIFFFAFFFFVEDYQIYISIFFFIKSLQENLNNTIDPESF